MRVAIVARRDSETNRRLAACTIPGAEVVLVRPPDALAQLRPGDVALGRLDVADALDGVESGLSELQRLEELGVRLLNRPSTLLASHDKLLTARVLNGAGLPHPRTAFVQPAGRMPRMRLPLVVKPRFGSWGQDVALCTSRRALEEQLCALAFRPWFLTRGALAQELVPPQGYDLRLVVAGGRVVGAVRRVARAGEWRTNVSLGARREPVEPPPDAAELAIAAAAAVEGALVGVDLLPLPVGGWTVLELNAAVDFTEAYAPRRDVFADALASAVEAAVEPPAAAAL
jgi:tetrahydromethanopterin:alpha-L-glutamate ligase